MAVSDSPDFDQPWQTRGPTQSFGSGTIVETPRGLRVLTNAHCVENQVFIELRRYGNTRKYAAQVEGVGHECDLALLSVEDTSFYAGATPIPIGELPELSEPVTVYGYPIGGERVSITQGIVSRIELTRYEQSQRALLAIQIDAAINSGNSGGPVIRDGKLVGVAFQALEDAEKIGYIIASPVIEHFLRDMNDGKYRGFPSLGVVTQALESDAHRRALGLSPRRDDGVLVTQVVYEGSGWGTVEPGDVLLEVDGVPIASDGTVPIRDGEVIDFPYVVLRRHVGDEMPLRIHRQGKELEVNVTLEPAKYLVTEDVYDVKPTYYIFGGLLFVPLTRDYLKTWDEPWWEKAPRDLMAIYDHGIRTPEMTQPVVLQKVLADRANQGYHDFHSALVRRVQGEPVRDIGELVSMVESTTGEFVRFDLGDQRQIVLDRAVAMKRHRAILKRFGVPEDRSEDLRREIPLQDVDLPIEPIEPIEAAGE